VKKKNITDVTDVTEQKFIFNFYFSDMILIIYFITIKKVNVDKKN